GTTVSRPPGMTTVLLSREGGARLIVGLVTRRFGRDVREGRLTRLLGRAEFFCSSARLISRIDCSALCARTGATLAVTTRTTTAAAAAARRSGDLPALCMRIIRTSETDRSLSDRLLARQNELYHIPPLT